MSYKNKGTLKKSIRWEDQLKQFGKKPISVSPELKGGPYRDNVGFWIVMAFFGCIDLQ